MKRPNRPDRHLAWRRPPSGRFRAVSLRRLRTFDMFGCFALPRFSSYGLRPDKSKTGTWTPGLRIRRIRRFIQESALTSFRYGYISGTTQGMRIGADTLSRRGPALTPRLAIPAEIWSAET